MFLKKKAIPIEIAVKIRNIEDIEKILDEVDVIKKANPAVDIKTTIEIDLSNRIVI